MSAQVLLDNFKYVATATQTTVVLIVHVCFMCTKKTAQAKFRRLIFDQVMTQDFGKLAHHFTKPIDRL